MEVHWLLLDFLFVRNCSYCITVSFSCITSIRVLKKERKLGKIKGALCGTVVSCFRMGIKSTFLLTVITSAMLLVTSDKWSPIALFCITEEKSSFTFSLAKKEVWTEHYSIGSLHARMYRR